LRVWGDPVGRTERVQVVPAAEREARERLEESLETVRRNHADRVGDLAAMRVRADRAEEALRRIAELCSPRPGYGRNTPMVDAEAVARAALAGLPEEEKPEADDGVPPDRYGETTAAEVESDTGGFQG
jgi:hypothetical protein